jgi:hypothetical protein
VSLAVAGLCSGTGVWGWWEQAGSVAGASRGAGTVGGGGCRVAAQRLDPGASGLRPSGPHGATAPRVLRTYAA